MRILIDGSTGLRPAGVISALMPLTGRSDILRLSEELCGTLGCRQAMDNGYYHVRCGKGSADAQKLRDMVSRCSRGEFLKALDVLLDAEEAFHGHSSEGIHLHEARNVGVYYVVLDAILEELDADLEWIPPLRTGSGIIEFSHGRFQLPAPATKEIISAHALPYENGGQGEMLPPSGAALAAVLPVAEVNMEGHSRPLEGRDGYSPVPQRVYLVE